MIEIMNEIRAHLERAFAARLRGVVLFGSEARGDARSDSDIDLLVLLTGPVHLWDDTKTATDALYELQLRLERPIHAMPVEEGSYTSGDFAVFRFAAEEGVRL